MKALNEWSGVGSGSVTGRSRYRGQNAAVYRIGVVGDYRASNPTHRATNDALGDASAVRGHECQVTWLGTAGL